MKWTWTPLLSPPRPTSPLPLDAAANYLACVNATQGPPLPPADAPRFSNVHITGLRGSVWRPVWLTCLPEAPCENITFADVRLDAIEPSWACTNVRGSAAPGVFPPATGCFMNAPEA